MFLLSRTGEESFVPERHKWHFSHSEDDIICHTMGRTPAQRLLGQRIISTYVSLHRHHTHWPSLKAPDSPQSNNMSASTNKTTNSAFYRLLNCYTQHILGRNHYYKQKLKKNGMLWLSQQCIRKKHFSFTQEVNSLVWPPGKLQYRHGDNCCYLTEMWGRPLIWLAKQIPH